MTAQTPARNPLESRAGELTTFYAKQAHMIDVGNHQAWAETFAPDGEFHSPTYPEPAVGHEALNGISRSFADAGRRAGEALCHVVTNLWVEKSTETSAHVRAYLMVVASAPDNPRILRIVTLDDDLIRSNDCWLVRYRRVEPLRQKNMG